jgi:predicted porin
MKMKRNLIAVAVGGAMSAAMVAPAMAEVTVYGLMQAELSSVSFQEEAPGCSGAEAKDATVANGCDGLVMTDNANGRIGAKASEDLGNGWTGLAKAEFKLDTSDGDAGAKAKSSINNGADTINDTGDDAVTTTVSGVALTPRELLVGMKGSGVQVELGRLKSAYKYTGGVKYDPFVATQLEARNDGNMMSSGAYGQGGFLSNTIGVEGGSGPVKARLTYSPNDGDGAYTLGVTFSQDAFEAFVAMADRGDQLDDGGADEQSYTATKIGGAFKTGPHKIMLQYEMVDADDDRDQTYAFLGYNMKMGKNTFVAEYGMYEADAPSGTPSDADPSSTTIVLGAIHMFSKQTRIFGGYRTVDADDDSRYDTVTVGLRKNF